MSTPTNDVTSSAVSHRRVLVVEDHEVASRSLARLLEAYGFEVVIAADGTTALALLAGESSFDFLLTDLQLPDIDGREIIQHARQLDPPPRVVLITGWDAELGPGDPDRLGIESVMPKPLDITALLAQLESGPAEK